MKETKNKEEKENASSTPWILASRLPKVLSNCYAILPSPSVAPFSPSPCSSKISSQCVE
ncbi:hypothetical protein ACE6H2_016039 [Prunus campanulata]